MDFDAAQRVRNAKFRRAVLVALYHASSNSPDGCLSGESIMENANVAMPHDQQIENDHAMRLIRDVVKLGLAEEKDAESLRRGERFGLRHVKFAITGRGVQLFEELIDPVEGVADSRQKIRR